jgi:hypothetical protein
MIDSEEIMLCTREVPSSTLGSVTNNPDKLALVFFSSSSNIIVTLSNLRMSPLSVPYAE